MEYIELTFESGNVLSVAMEDADQFMVELQQVMGDKGLHVSCVHRAEVTNRSVTDTGRDECIMTLMDGMQFSCWVETMMVSRVTDFPEVSACCLKEHLEKALRLKKEGMEIEKKLTEVIARVLDVKDTETKLELLEQCLKRKRGYLSAIRAITDGAGLKGDDHVTSEF